MADPGGERPQLRAVPAPVAELPAADGKPVYADVTGEAQRRPVLPEWARRGNFGHAVTRWRGWLWHEVRFHGLRSPVYVAKTAFWSVAGAVWLFVIWLQWWLMPVPLEAHAQAVGEGWRAWRTVHREHKQTAKVRFFISAGVAFGAVFAVEMLWLYLRPAVYFVAAAGLLAAARFGRPEGVRIVQQAYVPPEFEKLTQDVVTRGLGAVGNAKIDRWLREGKQIAYIGPIRQDGPGWRVEFDLPYGATITDLVEKREEFASGLRRPLGAVWPEGVSTEHPGRVELWVGQRDISKAKAPAWPLLKAGQADVFRPLPFAVDVRGRKVFVPMIYHNWLLGSIPRQGKTSAVRVLACNIALDPLVRPWVHELKGTGDLDPMEPLCDRFVSGIDDEAIGYAAQSLKILRTECERRGPKVRGLPLSICPEKRVTREICQKYRYLRPIVCIVDEAQNLFSHDKYGKQAGADAEFVIKVGPAMGIVLILATQRPDAKSLPTGVSANVSIRFCLKVMGQLENDMILGTSSYKNGIRATTFRAGVDAGLGYLISEDPAQVCRTYFLDVKDAQAVIARARVLRERAGTLPVPGEAEAPDRDVLGDVLAVMAGDPGLHWGVLAERLAERWPDRWAGATGDSVSAELRGLGVPSVTVSVGGQVLRGCRKQAVEQAAGRPLEPSSAP